MELKSSGLKRHHLLMSLTLPGCIQEQGYGEVPGPKTIWWDGKTLEGWFTSRPWINRKLALLTEAKVGKGKLMICSIDIETV